MGRNYRKRKTIEEEEDAEDQASALSLRDKLADTKALQKQRNRTAGLGVAQLDGTEEKGEEEEDEEELRPDEAKALQDTFANETTVAEEDPNMLSFIEEELRKRRGETQTVETADVSKTELQKIEDSLYETPKELQMQEVVEEDGSDRWLTGIVEVQLPVEHRLRNIELTEDAKKALLEKQKRRRYGSDRDRLPGNLSANFNLHRSQFAKQFGPGGGRTSSMQESDGREQRHHERFGGPGMGPNSRGPTATDDIVASRFKQRERQRRR